VPNPARSTVRFESGGLPPRASIGIYASSGRRVIRLSAETGDVWWNGEDESGGSVPAGVYFVRAEDERGGPLGAARKLVWLR
jgi:hypothetical protein